ncbi:[protein-PII] uridylyltransferase [Nocardioides sp. InS609-2]|uniref:[protein-PII] uridylyltransferase n=1 Tax=Nocardioides sp. InS609-2 TaxID=2760705 RepID=UPI0020BE0472|nr:[protein-PII] uridylyltransferase [Nocardioides sp. InS609-2]
MTASDRARRTNDADALCLAAYEKAELPEIGAALVAVGGYGRGELAPYSDLDVVLVHAADLDPGEGAAEVWYPLWDAGVRLDHAVRTEQQMLEAAADDVKVATGLLDARHLAGDPSLTLRLRTTMLAAWRRDARSRLPELHEIVRQRHGLVGEVAHESVPDIKEAAGGLRDATVLRALVATWLVDVPHVALERARQELLDLRDHVHEISGRATDRVGPEVWSELAGRIGVEDAAAAQVALRETGRRIAHIHRLTWRRVDGVLARPVSVKGTRRPDLQPVARGIALSSGEVVLDGRVAPADDPLLLLRAAAEAAEREVALSPATASRLVRESPPVPEPWPAEARDLLVRLLASGRGLLGVWETLEETGAVDRVLPEWQRIRLLPHASAIHRFTVDRHVVETCIEASALIRTVSRPDVLMVAALLHDIGKGELTEHSVAGEPIARRVAARMGFDAAAVDHIGTLVRWHLLLSTVATTRDPDDPATTAQITARITTPEAMSLLLALTEADSRAASAKAWSSWRAGLVKRLAAHVVRTLESGQAPTGAVRDPVDVPEDVRRGATSIAVLDADDGVRVRVIAPDRVGLLADVAAMLALQRTSVRGARAWTQNDVAVSEWDVTDTAIDPAVLRQRFDSIVSGRIDPGERLRPAGSARDGAALAPTVAMRSDASTRATVLEVRAADRPGVLHLVCAALAELGVTVASAHVDTVGPQAVDVFYVQEQSAGPLADHRAAAAAHAVRAALTPL